MALPVASTAINPDDGQTYLTLTYLRRSDAPQLTYTVFVSDDFLVWESGPAFSEEIGATLTGDSASELVTVRILPAIAAATPRLFARVAVSAE